MCPQSEFAFFLTQAAPVGVTTTGALGYMARLMPPRMKDRAAGGQMSTWTNAALPGSPLLLVSHCLTNFYPHCD